METVWRDARPQVRPYQTVENTIKAIDGKSPPRAENEAIPFDDSKVFYLKQIVDYFNRQFTTSKLGRHTSSRETLLVSREIKGKS